MHQGRGVDNFNHRAKFHRPSSLIIEKFGGEQQKRGTNAFASATAQVFANFGNGGDVRNRVAAELALDGGEIVAKEFENFGSIDGDGVHDFSPRAPDALSGEFSSSGNW